KRIVASCRPAIPHRSSTCRLQNSRGRSAAIRFGLRSLPSVCTRPTEMPGKSMSHGAPKATHWGRQGSALREGTDTGCYRFWCEGVHHGRTPSKTSAFAPNCGAQAPPQNWPNEGPEIWFGTEKNFRQENCREAIAKALVAARDAGK